MKPSALLVAVNYLALASAAAVANADNSVHDMQKRACFNSGVTFGGDRKNALSAADRACSGPLKGRYYKRQTLVECSNIARNKRVMLTVGLSGPNAPGSKTITKAECYDGLIGEIMRCPKGGDTTYGTWRYR